MNQNKENSKAIAKRCIMNTYIAIYLVSWKNLQSNSFFDELWLSQAKLPNYRYLEYCVQHKACSKPWVPCPPCNTANRVFRVLRAAQSMQEIVWSVSCVQHKACSKLCVQCPASKQQFGEYESRSMRLLCYSAYLINSYGVGQWFQRKNKTQN